ncbi:MAG: lytic transglycosylase domain-containing protein, partial [Bacteroidota bacterium]|nr:lytic transglycosylase domain-containing protein [Bacteroidota bacterium]
MKKISEFIIRFKRYFIAFGCLIVILSIIKIFTFSYSDNSSDSTYEDYFNASYKVFSIRIPKNLNFAGEKTPITDFSVREAMERELVINTYWQSQSLLIHKRASRWFPVIEPILEKNGIPDDFKYIALIESQLTNAVSPQGAT